jgi:hypothetical protein
LIPNAGTKLDFLSDIEWTSSKDTKFTVDETGVHPCHRRVAGYCDGNGERNEGVGNDQHQRDQGKRRQTDVCGRGYV